MKAVFFDLDYTLYDTDQYYLGAFEDISKYLEAKYNLPKKDVYQTLVTIWKEKTEMYSYLFNDLVEYYNLKHENIENIVEIFNKHEINSLSQLYPDVVPTLNRLRSENYKLGIITDGDMLRQVRKIQKFELDKLVDSITYTEKTAAKPSTIPFVLALQELNVEPSSAVYVADNPFVDFKGAKMIGMKTARILRGKFALVPLNDHVDYRIEGLSDIMEILKM